jgi:hypothetical protein
VALFSTGALGADYQDHYCARCVHGQADECPVWFLHNRYTPAETEGLLQDALDELIPQDEDGGPGRCRMFVEVGG